MPLNLFQKIAQEASRYTDLVALHVLGDPLLVENLRDYLDHLPLVGLKAEITTSGFHLSESKHSLLWHPAIHQINFSLSSFFANRSSLALQKYLETIEQILEKKRESHQALFINLRLWNLHEENRNQEIITWLERLFSLKIDQTQKRQRLDSRIILDLDKLFTWPSLEAPSYGKKGYCLGLETHCGILADGSAIPCCLDSLGILTLGNMHQGSLKEALASPRAKEILEGFQRGERVERLCQHCGYSQRFSNS